MERTLNLQKMPFSIQLNTDSTCVLKKLPKTREETTHRENAGITQRRRVVPVPNSQMESLIIHRLSISYSTGK